MLSMDDDGGAGTHDNAMDIVQVDAGAAAGAGTSADHGAVHEQEEEEIAAVERVEGGGPTLCGVGYLGCGCGGS